MLVKTVVEAIGTFFLMLTIGQVVLEPGAGTFAPLAIGSALMAMVYAGGHLSGGHYNPAVTLGVLVRGRTSTTDMLAYWVAQIVGAVAAVFVVQYLKGEVAVIAPSPAAGPLFLAEFLFTFALVYIVLNVATARATEGNSHYGLAIGFIVMVGAYAVGPISGAAFNPAVAIGVTLLGLSAPANLWIYLASNLLGGAAAGLLFRALDLGAEKPAPRAAGAATPA